MKRLIISVNDTLAYLVLVVFVLVGYGAANSMGVGPNFGVIGAIAGFVLGSLFAGFWFVLSGIYEELRKANESNKRVA